MQNSFIGLQYMTNSPVLESHLACLVKCHFIGCAESLMPFCFSSSSFLLVKIQIFLVYELQVYTHLCTTAGIFLTPS